jgi:hypothetical protein
MRTRRRRYRERGGFLSRHKRGHGADTTADRRAENSYDAAQRRRQWDARLVVLVFGELELL